MLACMRARPRRAEATRSRTMISHIFPGRTTSQTWKSVFIKNVNHAKNGRRINAKLKPKRCKNTSAVVYHSSAENPNSVRYR